MSRRRLTNQAVIKKYEGAGKRFARAVAKNLCATDIVGFLLLFNRWKKWEKSYVTRGYRALPFYTFIDHRNNDPMEPIPGLGQRRTKEGAKLFYAPEYAIDNNLNPVPKPSVFMVVNGDF